MQTQGNYIRTADCLKCCSYIYLKKNNIEMETK